MAGPVALLRSMTTFETGLRGDAKCLLCANFRPKPPEGWKPTYPGSTYDLHSVRSHYVDTEMTEWPKGWCCLNPVALEVSGGHWCASFTIHRWLIDWGLFQAVGAHHRGVF